MESRTPPVPCFSPSHAFVFGAVKSLVSPEDDMWVDGIHSEHRETNAVTVRAAVSFGEAPRWDLDPRHAAVHRLVEVMVRVTWRQKIKDAVDHAQSIPRTC